MGNDIKKRGVAQSDLIEPIPNRLDSETETVLKGKNNTYIVLGRDRPSGLLSGYGGIGEKECGTIDLVAGLGARDIQQTDKEGNPLFYNNSFRKDAARVYISQRTDVDVNFEVAPGSTGISKNRSAVVLKADDVRIIGRESVKIVTRTDLRNSRGGNLAMVGGIQLIAGNDDSDLQPIPKGNNVAKAISDLADRIKELNGIVTTLLSIQSKFNEKVATHVHIPPLLTQAESTWFTSEALNDKVLPLSATGEMTMAEFTSKVLASLETANVNCEILKANYLNTSAKNYINSKYNKTN